MPCPSSDIGRNGLSTAVDGDSATYLPANTGRQVLDDEAVFGSDWWPVSESTQNQNMHNSDEAQLLSPLSVY